MTRVKNINVFYVLFIIVFLTMFIFDFYQLFKNLDAVKKTLGANKYTDKINATKELMKIYQQPLFNEKFLNEFRSYGEWPLVASSSPRGPEVFSNPEEQVEQLIDLQETLINPPVTR